MKILPHQIDVLKPFDGIFGRREIEIFAQMLVKFCQDRNKGWEPFSHQELSDYFSKRIANEWRNGYWLRPLVQGGYATQDGKNYQLNELFVEKCFACAPKQIEVTLVDHLFGGKILAVDDELFGLVSQIPKRAHAKDGGKWRVGIMSADGCWISFQERYETQEAALELAITSLKRNFNFEQWYEYLADKTQVIKGTKNEHSSSPD